MTVQAIKARTREAEHRMARMFSSERPFSAHLIKWEDPLLPDKYDFNCFFCTGQPETEELAAALRYQKETGATFLKLESDAPLQNSFGLEQSVTLTMALLSPCNSWKRNPFVMFGTPTLAQAEELDVRHYGAAYGEDFTRRNIRRMYRTLHYHGAFLNGALACMCYTFESGGCVCLDGLLTDEACRGQGVATTLLGQIAGQNEGKLLFLHADADDTPRQMYEKLGFCAVDTLYEYLCPDLASLRLPNFNET